MMNGTAVAFPNYQGNVFIGMANLQALLQTFTWNGIHWSSGIVIGRMLWIFVAFGISLLAALFFRRFDPAPQRIKPTRDAEQLMSPPLELVQPAPMPVPGRLTPLTSKHRAYHPMRIFLAELRLLLKGIGRWWYVLLIGLNIAGLLLPTEAAHRYLLPVA